MDAHQVIVREKITQAAELLKLFEADAWLTFARETSLSRDPALEIIYPHAVTWLSAFLVTPSGEAIAILGRYDAVNAERTGAFTQVIPYDESIRPALVEVLARIHPGKLAVNYSPNDPASDGLTVGMRMLLEEVLSQAGISPTVLVSAEGLLTSLRGRKTATEINHIRRAIETTESMFAEAGGLIEVGKTELEIAALMQDSVDSMGLGYAWDRDGDPLVNTGPESDIGHALPGHLKVEPGHLVHLDFGVKQEGYCSDLQRTWYVLKPGEVSPPNAILDAWQAARRALLAGTEAMRPGTKGWEVDAAARESLVADGYPEYQHAYGHHLGRVAHDGGTVLGPRWDRYGQQPYWELEAGNVFAVELGVELAEYGPVYLEENVLVTDDGIEWLSSPQTEIWLIQPDSA